jgi:UDP-glucuronate 4-epimerase
VATLITGAAGFIGSQLAMRLLARGKAVIGLDNLNNYYTPALKQDRLKQLQANSQFLFAQIDLADADAVADFLSSHPHITQIVHLAAQAGVRYSIENPLTYADSNMRGTVALLEAARHLPKLAHVVYASSSSVYGDSQRIPFREDDPADAPLSVYAASKRATEHLAAAYAHLYRIPCTGLRFFTVYGPWGRPDMAYFHFARAIMRGEPITLFANGEVKRDYTFIEDILDGIEAAMRTPFSGANPHRVFNLGNHRPETVAALVEALEKGLDKRAEKHYANSQLGDAAITYADISKSNEILGFEPKTTLDDGIARFAQWFLAHGVQYG